MASQLPEELKNLPFWCLHRNKRPLVRANRLDMAVTYNSVCQRQKRCPGTGLMILLPEARVSDLVALDVDVPDKRCSPAEWPAAVRRSIQGTSLATLLQRTYAEYSPSRAGIHIYVYLRGKEKLRRCVYTPYPGSPVVGQLSVRNQAMTVTGNRCAESPVTIGVVDVSELTDVFPLVEEHIQPQPQPQPQPQSELPSEEEIESCLRALPLGCDHRTKKAWEEMTGKEYQHYEFWCSVGMMLHDYGVQRGCQLRMLQAFVEWSKNDPTPGAFTGVGSVEEKWKSFSASPDREGPSLTWRSLRSLAHTALFEYPYPRMIKGKVYKSLPVFERLENFIALMDKYHLKLYENQCGYFLQGDKDIIDTFFHSERKGARWWPWGVYGPIIHVEDLRLNAWRLLQNSNWTNVTYQTVKHHLLWWTRRENMLQMNMPARWLETPEKQLSPDLLYAGEVASFIEPVARNTRGYEDLIYSCLNVPDETHKELYQTYLRVWFRSVVKGMIGLRSPFREFGGVLILVGGENLRKTTFFNCLFPRGIQDMTTTFFVQNTTSDKNRRDLIRCLCRYNLVILDEIETVLSNKGHDSSNKALLTGSRLAFTEIFTTTSETRERTAAVGGTTNVVQQDFSSTGSRRLWFIPVGVIDTSTLLQVNWHEYYSLVAAEMQEEVLKPGPHVVPWNLPTEAVTETNEVNEVEYSNPTEMECALDNVFAFDTRCVSVVSYLVNSLDDRKKLMGLQSVRRVLELEGERVSSYRELRAALVKKCALWTKTQGKRVKLTYPFQYSSKGNWTTKARPGYVENGKYRPSEDPGRRLHYYIMPPLRGEEKKEKSIIFLDRAKKND